MVHNVPNIVEFEPMSYKVLICDDEPDLAKSWLDEIGKVADPSQYDLCAVPTKEAISASIKVLLARRSALRANKDYPPDPCIFDEVDIVIIDYDLIHVDEANNRYTGEGVARLARVYSPTKLIIVLNQFIESQFDLGLRGHLESFADLNLDASLVSNQGLWQANKWEGFRPWHWPVLDRAVSKMTARLKQLSSRPALETPIIAALGMTVTDVSRLSDTAFGFIAPDVETFGELEKQTFVDFLKVNSAAVETSDAEALLERDVGACARLSASRIAKWLEREVLGPQDVLIDLPHLLQRCPYLFNRDLQKIETWNEIGHSHGESLREEFPRGAFFSADVWVDKPVFWWNRIDQDPMIEQVRDKYDFAEVPDFVFLEDASKFIDFENATEFRAGFHNAYDRRFVQRFEEIRYSPQRRFAFGTS
jgi:hypothetical protein